MVTQLNFHVKTTINKGETVLIFGWSTPADKTLSKRNKNVLQWSVTKPHADWTQLIEDGVFTGKKKEIYFLRNHNWSKFKHVILAGLGEWDGKNHEVVRNVAGQVWKLVKKEQLSDLSILVTDSLELSHSENIRALAEGLGLSNYEFSELKSKSSKADAKGKIVQVTFLCASNQSRAVSEAVEEAQCLIEGTNFARYLGDLPGNYLPPRLLAQKVQEKFRGSPVKVTIWDKKRIEKEKLGGLLTVAKGSDEEPRLIWLEYNGTKDRKSKPIVLVGKGLTFDSGGISIKPSASMEEMKYDMCGAAAVFGTFLALMKSQAPVHVVGIVPATENMPSGKATKPGDVYVARNGKTVEVNNTDAEGRLILGEALTLASELKPKAILDAATLTGAIVVALGNIHTGYFTRKDDLASQIEKSAHKSGERVWRMPLVDEHVEDMKGTYADLSNISSNKGAGSATAAAFLEQFVDQDIPWAHFDIAGTAWAVGNRLTYCPSKGASGVMVRTFYELVQSLAQD